MINGCRIVKRRVTRLRYRKKEIVTYFRTYCLGALNYFCIKVSGNSFVPGLQSSVPFTVQIQQLTKKHVLTMEVPTSKFDLIFTNLGLVQIAKTIYRHLDLKTLSNCRSVSKSWKTSIGNVSAVCLHFNYKCQLFIYIFFNSDDCLLTLIFFFRQFQSL